MSRSRGLVRAAWVLALGWVACGSPTVVPDGGPGPDRCLVNNGECSAFATCASTAGGRTCTCNAGFTGNGLTCADVNECLTGNGGCDPQATCTNVPGGRTCACQAGWAGTGLSCAWDGTALSGLSVSPGLLTFAPGTLGYAVELPAGTASVELVATVAMPALATLSVNGQPATSGQPVAVPIAGPFTRVTVGVTAASGRAELTTLVFATRLEQQAYLKASTTGRGHGFGLTTALSADGHTLAVGAWKEGGAPGPGAVFVFTRTGTLWTQQAALRASSPGDDDLFGSSLALSADGLTLAVGAPKEDSAATGVNGVPDEGAVDSGAVSVFARSGGTWTQQAWLKAARTRADDRFGASLALSADGSTLAVGAPQEDGAAEAAQDSGAVSVFFRQGSAWAPQAVVRASNPDANDKFGSSLALSADGATLAVGAVGEASAATGAGGDQSNDLAPASGAAYLFTRAGQAWAQQAYLKASNTGTADLFGFSLALSGDGATLAVGAPGEDSGPAGAPADNGAPGAGAVYVLRRTGGAGWATRTVKAPNAEAFDAFGSAVALSADGSTLVVGAPEESSSARGPRGAPGDNTAARSGAAYVFAAAREGWALLTYTKASNTGADDRFATSLAVSAEGTTLAFGAPQEASSATGVGGNEASDASPGAGAAYVLVR